ncbi:MAG: PAS domain-containing protein [Rhizobiaceae bacterium]|nr:PAS domain-containing protein [Rhizobiaceae bacterium]
MRHDGTMELFQYWNRLRRDRPAPRRTEIEPADIKNLLANTFIIEADARGEAVFRLAGTRLCAMFGRELKSFAFASLWTQRDQRVIARLMYGALHQNSVTVIEMEAASRGGRSIALELIALPLTSSADGPRALGSIVPMEKPFWLGADPIAECRIESLRAVDPDVEPVFLKNRPSVPVPPLAADLLGRRKDDSPSGRRVRHLVVLEGGRDGS